MFRKFLKWMRFNPPYALGWDEWKEFHERHRKEAPVRYFITEVLGKQVRRLISDIANIRNQIAYRTTRRYHIINTRLEPGYYDTDTQMLHGCFSLLVDYVECECAWMHIVFDTERYRNALGMRRFLPRTLRSTYRNKADGFAHLEWEMTLDNPALPPSERCDSQARKARDVLQLYKWWTEIRPARESIPYPHRDDSPGLEFLSQQWKSTNPEKAKAISEWANRSNIQEEAWNEEDTIMLMKLVRIRKSLWT